MSAPGHSLPIFDADNASATMGITLDTLSVEDASATFSQRAESWHTGLDGDVSIGSLGPLIDATLGSVSYLTSEGTDRNYVMSALAASFSGTPGVGDTIHAYPVSSASDTRTDSIISAGEVHGRCGLIATATCRAVPVRRPQALLRTVVAEPAWADLPTRRNRSDRAGQLVLKELRARQSLRAPFPAALGIELTEVGAAEIAGSWETASWMMNPLGSVQGGIVLAAAMEAAQLTLAAIRAAGETIYIGDVGLDLLGSPTADETIMWRGAITRAGRRLVTGTVTLTDATGRELARARYSALRQASR